MTNTAWVVGAGGGIGAACAERLRRDGFNVHGSDRPEEDITEPGRADQIAQRLVEAGGFAAAVHTIGMSGRRLGDGPIAECTDHAWEEVMRIDLTSAFQFLRACLNNAQDGASIVLIGSALAKGLDADFLTAAYRVAKAGLIPLAEAAAFEGAARGIRINVVAPGLVDTPMAARALSNRAIRARFGELMPLTARPAAADEVAAAVSWLTGPDSIQTTGALIPVDGGWTLGGARRNGANQRTPHPDEELR